MPTYRRAVDMEGWKSDPRIAARGFNHDYDAYVEDGSGEDFFLALVENELGAEVDLLDVGCGHGDLTLELAQSVRSVVGVDRTPGLIDLAWELASERGTSNARFVHAELAGPDVNRPRVPLPLEDGSIDLVIDRRGPTIERFIDGLGRVGRPGTLVIGVHPAGGPPAPRWADELPSFRHRFDAIDPAIVRAWVVNPAERRGLHSYRLWWIDVPEHLPTPRALYDKLKFDGSPAYEAVAVEIEGAFDRHAEEEGIALRHQRLVFTLRMP